MAIKINFDNEHNAIEPTLVLANRNGHRIGGLPAVRINFEDSLGAASNMNFSVNKADCKGDIGDDLWEQLTDFKLLWVKEWNRLYELTVTVKEADGTEKGVSAVSLGDAELSQINVYDLEINTEDDILREDYVPSQLYNEDNPKASIINRVLEKAPHYHIRHVDESLKTLQRYFSFNNKSIDDAFSEIAQEVECLFVYDCYLDENGGIHRDIDVYDLRDYCYECGERGDFDGVCPNCGSTIIKPGYGNDTSIFVSRHNLADSIEYSSDVKSVKNCFKLEAGDDLMTATVVGCNPNGSDYLWFISDEVRADMSPALSQKLAEYDSLYDEYQTTHETEIPQDILIKYNELVEKYSTTEKSFNELPSPVVGYPALMQANYDTIDLQMYLAYEMMPKFEIPETDAETELYKLMYEHIVAIKNAETASKATVDGYVSTFAKYVVDPRYKVTIDSSTYANSTWTGNVTVTSYSDEEDTASATDLTYAISDDFELYIKQIIDRKLKSDENSVSNIGLTALFSQDDEDFIKSLRKYSLSYLKILFDSCDGCINVMTEQGVSNQSIMDNIGSDVYDTVYEKYYNRLGYIVDEMNLRQRELDVITGTFYTNGAENAAGVQTILRDKINSIHSTLNFSEYLGETLWNEFCSYRREMTYSNPNYVSDGLSNAEVFENALQFIEAAKKEVVKSATLQHSINADMNNLLVIKEFAPLVDSFEVGNWIRLGVDKKVYKLRIVGYEISFDDIGKINVEFSDVYSVGTGYSDLRKILSNASSMASSYDYVTRQANKGAESNSVMSGWVNNGLDLTNTKIVNDADNQNVEFNKYGISAKRYMPELDAYDDRQIKIINSGVYVTDDNWKTSKAGIGNFIYYNPKTGKYEEAYGVVADTIVGNIVLSKEVGVYNEQGSIKMDGDGVTITSVRKEGSDPSDVFTIQRETTSGGVDKLLYFNDDGDLVINGSVKVASQSGTPADGTIQAISAKTDEVYNKVKDFNGLYFYVMYSAYSDGRDMSATPDANTKYMGTCKTDVSTAPTDPSEYTWVEIKGSIGSSGYSNAQVFLYKRSESDVSIDWDYSLTYTFATGEFDRVPTGWSRTVPDGDAPIYMTSATAGGTEATDTIAYTEWSDPVILAQNGESGDNGYNSATVFLYKRSPTVPDKPTVSMTYTFSTGALSTTGGWSKTVPSGTTPCYIIQATAISSEDTYVITADKWSDPEVLAQNGQSGTNGRNSATIYLYKRSASAASIDWTNALEYTFSTSTISVLPTGWYQSIPDGSEAIYVTSAVASSTSDTDSIAYTEWSTPVVMAQSGTSGLNTATIQLYKRNNGAPSRPAVDIVYTFASGSLSSTGGWFLGVPSGSNPCYVIQATAISADATYTIPASQWTEPEIMVRDGEQGIPGEPGANGRSSYLHIKYSNDGVTFTELNGEVLGSYIGTLVDYNVADSNEPSDYTWKKFSGDVDNIIDQLRREMSDRFDDMEASNNSSMAAMRQEIDNVKKTNEDINKYQADIGQYISTGDTGLVLGATSSRFKTVIDNRGVYFREGNTVVSYVNNKQMHIPNAVVDNTLAIGNFFFTPRSDGGVSLIWDADGQQTIFGNVINTANEVICTIDGRVYKKYNSDEAITAVFQNGDYLGPLLVSRTKDGAAFVSDSYFGVSNSTVVYNGITYYVSQTGYFMYKSPTTTFTKNKRTIVLSGTYSGSEAAGLALLEYYNGDF